MVDVHEVHQTVMQETRVCAPSQICNICPRFDLCYLGLSGLMKTSTIWYEETDDMLPKPNILV